MEMIKFCEIFFFIQVQYLQPSLKAVVLQT